MSVPKTASGNRLRRRPARPCSRALARTIDEPRRCSASVEKSIQRPSARSHDASDAAFPRKMTVKISVFTRIATCRRSSLACTRPRRVIGAGNRKATSGGENANALRSLPNSHQRADDANSRVLASNRATGDCRSAVSGAPSVRVLRKSAHQIYSTPSSTALM